MRYKVINTSQHSPGGKRNVFITEAGKLIKPGEHCVCNRLDAGTHAMTGDKTLKIEEGKFSRPPLFKDEPVKPASKPTQSALADKARAAADARAMDERMAAAEDDESESPPTADEARAAADARAMDERLAAAEAEDDDKPTAPSPEDTSRAASDARAMDKRMADAKKAEAKKADKADKAKKARAAKAKADKKKSDKGAKD